MWGTLRQVTIVTFVCLLLESCALLCELPWVALHWWSWCDSEHCGNWRWAARVMHHYLRKEPLSEQMTQFALQEKRIILFCNVHRCQLRERRKVELNGLQTRLPLQCKSSERWNRLKYKFLGFLIAYFYSKVVRRLAHGERKGRAPHGLPFIAIWSLHIDLPWLLPFVAIWFFQQRNVVMRGHTISAKFKAHNTLYLAKDGHLKSPWIFCMFTVSDQKWLPVVTTETWFRTLRKLSR